MSLTSSYSLVPVGYPDSHWSLILAPSTFVVPKTNSLPGLVYVSTLDGTNWTPNTSTSQWVGPTVLPVTTNPAGTYVYSYQFDLTGLTLSTVTLTGLFVAAESGELYLNGNPITVSSSSGAPVPAAFSVSYSINPSYFNPGINYLTVSIAHSGSGIPTGFQLNIAGTATNTSTSTTVPVPVYGTGVFSFNDPSIVPPPTANVTAYTGLITSEHANKAKYIAWVSTLAQAFVDLQNTLIGMPLDFYLVNAVGSQLDFLGQWINAPRALNVPIGSVTSMDDNTYRLVLRAKAAANSWDSTLPTAANILNSVFAGSGTNLFLQDNQDMSQTIGIVGVLPSTLLLQLIIQNYLGLKPAGVLQNVVESSISNAPIFGFDVENQYVSGCDVGAWGTIYTGA